MKAFVKKILSHDAPPLIQFIKYGAVGVLSTFIQMAVFYLLACTVILCLNSEDAFLKLLDYFNIDSKSIVVNISDSTRAWRAAFATGIGFVIANVFCWIMNRLFVFKPGRHKWYIEFFLFFSTALIALFTGIAIQTVLIKFAGWTTSSAFILEIVSSFAINYIVRKFFIFKG